MNFVEPIRDKQDLRKIINWLRDQGRFRDLLLFTVGINTVLLISDLLALRIGDFIDGEGEARQQFQVGKSKHNKRHVVVINDSIRQALADYREAYPGVEDNPAHFVFFNTRIPGYARPISRVQAWKLVVAICLQVGLRGNYGTHTLRKTWGYHAYMNGMDLALLMDILNHNSLASTRQYLGIMDDELREVTNEKQK